MGIPNTTPPYPDDTYQQDLQKSVNDYNNACMQKNSDIYMTQQALAGATAMQKAGNYDGAMMIVILVLFMYILKQSQDDQIKDTAGQEVSSSYDAMSTHIMILFDAGESNDGKDDGTGMTNPQGKQFYEEQSDEWYDLHNNSSLEPDGTTGNLLYMIDPSAKSQLSDSISDMMNLYGLKTDPNQNLPLYPGTDEEQTAEKIAESTNSFWSDQGQTGSPPNASITNFHQDSQRETNTCNAQVQSFNANYQTDVGLFNSYVGSENSIMSSEIDQDQTMVSNLKG